jgi:Domain of unknown function (DUF4296)
MIRICMLLCALGLITSCGHDKTPPGILEPNKMQAVLWDVIKAEAFTNDFIKKDSAKNAAAENLKLQQQIFAIHRTTKDVFYKSYDYYKTNTPVFKVMLDSMIAQAGRNKNYGTKPLTAE